MRPPEWLQANSAIAVQNGMVNLVWRTGSKPDGLTFHWHPDRTLLGDKIETAGIECLVRVDSNSVDGLKENLQMGARVCFIRTETEAHVAARRALAEERNLEEHEVLEFEGSFLDQYLTAAGWLFNEPDMWGEHNPEPKIRVEMIPGRPGRVRILRGSKPMRDGRRYRWSVIASDLDHNEVKFLLVALGRVDDYMNYAACQVCDSFGFADGADDEVIECFECDGKGWVGWPKK